jgi:EAL domain-containing protein (putative c-di-GMP-specific phosphodiesterase class I)
VSPIQLRCKDFVSDVKVALAAAASHHCIDIEITESMLMEDIEGSIAKLGELRAAGLGVSLDDFGTGHSSLSWLARLPVDSLKIDRSFIVGMAEGSEHVAIVSTVISLARALNLKVVAEGLETKEQADFLKVLRCDEAQGYLISRPLPADQLVELLRKGVRAAV